MAVLKIDTYYDLRCSICGNHWSTDYNHGMDINRNNLKASAYREGWTTSNGENVCPRCNAEKMKGKGSYGWTP